jgi:hypothetical protein
MTQNSVNNEKKSRVIRETKKADFLEVVSNIRDIINGESFDDHICEMTGNGLYKLTTTRPSDMTGVKETEKAGLKWYKVPTTDYRVAVEAYVQYRLTCEVKANSNALKKFADLSLEQKLALLEKAAELLG